MISLCGRLIWSNNQKQQRPDCRWPTALNQDVAVFAKYAVSTINDTRIEHCRPVAILMSLIVALL